MPKIPEFQRRVFTPKAVGTPGVDQSVGIVPSAVVAAGQQSVRSLSAGSQAIGEASRLQKNSVRAFEQVGVDLANATDRVLAAQKQKQTILDTYAVNSEQFEFRKDVLSLTNDLQNEFRDKPEGLIDAFSERANRISEERLASISDAKVQQKSGAAHQSFMSSLLPKLNNIAEKQKITNLKSDFDNKLVQTIDTVNQIDMADPEANSQFLAELGVHAQFLAANAPAFGAGKVASRTATDIKAISKGFINNNILENPVAIAAWIKGGVFDSMFDEPEREDFINKADTSLKSITARAKRDDMLSVLAMDATIFENLGKSEQTLGDLEVLRDLAVAKKDDAEIKHRDNQIEAALQQSNPLFIPDAPTVNLFYSKYLNLVDTSGKPAIKDEVDLESQVAYNHWIAEQIRLRKLPAKVAGPVQKLLAQGIAFAAQQEKSFSAGIFAGDDAHTVFNESFRSLNNFMHEVLGVIKNSPEIDNLRAEFFPGMVERFITLKDLSPEKPISRVDSGRIVEDVKQAIRRKLNPDSDRIAEAIERGHKLSTPLGMLQPESQLPDGSANYVLPEELRK